jgi:protease-4
MRLAVLLPLTSLFAGCSIVIPIGPSNDRGRLNMETVEPARGYFNRDAVLLLPLSGLVTVGDLRTGMEGDTGMLVQLKDRLAAARRNPHIKAVVLRIDSPGGTVTASDLIHRELAQFKKETGLPVIAQLGDTAASGGVYVAMAADEIYALPTTITGSIGVVALYPDLAGLMGKIGVGVNVIKAGSMKDAGSPWRTMTSAEREYFQGIVDEFNVRFRQVILEAREPKGMTAEGLAKVADGRVLTPDQAVQSHLIDGIAYHDEVFDRARALAGSPRAGVVTYEYPMSYRGNVYASAPPSRARADAGPATINLLSLGADDMARELFGARFLYMWMP